MHRHFGNYVTMDTMIRAGFNESAGSVSFSRNGKNYDVHLATYPDTDLTVVVMDEKAGKRRQWYLGSIRGTPIEDRETDEAIDEFMTLVQKVITRRNRVAGLDLDTRINDVINSYCAEKFIDRPFE